MASLDYTDDLFTNYSSNATNYTNLPPFTYPPSFQTLVYTLYTIIFLTAIIGNTLVIAVVSSQQKMRTPTNYLIANLALGDLLMALLCVPFGYISILHQSWPFGELLCHLVTPAQCVFVFVSAWTLVVLSLERYFGIVYWEKSRWGRRGVLWGVFTVWVGSMIVSIPVGVVVGVTGVEDGDGDGRVLCEEIHWPSPSLRLTYTLTLLFLQYFLPISVLIFTYTRIAIEIWWKKSCPVLESCGSVKSVREERLERAKRRTISTLLLVVTSYTLAWLPLNLLYLYLEAIPVEKEPFDNVEYVYILCHWVAMAHTTFNPIIYGFVNSRFREGFGIVLNNFWRGCCWSSGRRRQRIERGAGTTGRR